MKTRYILYILLCSFSISYGQKKHFECGTPSLNDIEFEKFKNEIFKFEKDGRKGKVFEETQWVPIKITYFLHDQGYSNFKPKGMNLAIAAANAYFSKINIQFFILGTDIKGIKNSKFYEFKRNSITDENEIFLAAGEVKNAINLVVVDQLNYPGLNGAAYAYYPNATDATTLRIVLSAFQTLGGFSDVESKTLIHELGHHFGLLHTFDNTAGKELVTRGSGANCATTGDLICDTPADPFDQIPVAQLPQSCGVYNYDLKDSKGEKYEPNISNFMTAYRDACRNNFTEGQYQKMLAGLNIRKSSTLYNYSGVPTVVNTPTFNFVEAQKGVVVISFKDNASNETGYIIERSENASSNFVAIGATNSNGNFYYDLNATAGKTYFYRIRGSNAINYSQISSPIIAQNSKYCIPYARTTCFENFTNFNIYNFEVLNTNYKRTGVASQCSSNFNYTDHTNIAINTNAGVKYQFKGTLVKSSGGSFNVFAWIDFDNNGEFSLNEIVFKTNYSGTVLPPTGVIGNFEGTFDIPQNHPSGDYRLRLRSLPAHLKESPCENMPEGETQDYTLRVAGSSVFKLTAGAISTNSVCPNTSITVPITTEGAATANTKNTIQLSDNQGLNYKELTTTVEGTNLKATIPANTKAGSGYRIKIVSTNPTSESISPTSLTIKANATATFETKDLVIDQYKSADIKLALTGDVPIKLKISDGQNLDFNELNPTIKLAPNTTTEYKISSVSNTCGDGVASAVALKITVNVINANEPTFEALQVFPNPSAEQITVKFDKQINANQKLQLIDNKGVMFFQKTIESNEESINLKEIPIGIYHVRIMDGKQVLSKKMIKIE